MYELYSYFRRDAENKREVPPQRLSPFEIVRFAAVLAIIALTVTLLECAATPPHETVARQSVGGPTGKE